MLSMRDGDPALNETARDWANGVLTVLDDMRRETRGPYPTTSLGRCHDLSNLDAVERDVVGVVICDRPYPLACGACLLL